MCGRAKRAALSTPLALYAGAEGNSIAEAVRHLASTGGVGRLEYFVYFLLVLSAEGSVPALMIVSKLQADLEAAATRKAKADSALATVSHSAAMKMPDKIKVALVEADGQTNKELAAAVGTTPPTIAKHTKTLEEEGLIHGVPGAHGVTWYLGAKT